MPGQRVIVVDGERFVVDERDGARGVYDLTWASGPEGRGFTTSNSQGRALTDAELAVQIRSYLVGETSSE